MQCPKCRTKLKEHKVQQGNIAVYACVDCKGVWFDGRELEMVLTETFERLTAPEDAPRTTLFCPRCFQFLTRFPYPGTDVSVDMCKSCRGVWFDAGELKEIKRILRVRKKFGPLHDASSVASDVFLNFIEASVSAMEALTGH